MTQFTVGSAVHLERYCVSFLPNLQLLEIDHCVRKCGALLLGMRSFGHALNLSTATPFLTSDI
jgi:hypothetical protein